MADFVFASMASSAVSARQALLWARSIRAFAGRFADAPILLMVPEHKERLAASLRVEFGKTGVRLETFKISSSELDFPFAGKTLAAGTAERVAPNHASFLVWMDRDSLIIQEPLPLLLENSKVLGYRPVDHTLIGSPASKPLDPFWSMIYSYCGVDRDQIGSMVTCVDEETIRPYFNAGMLVVRPQQGLLRRWSESFVSLYTQPAFTRFYKSDFLYRLFIHQAILSGTILANTKAQARVELPPLINYPLHMHDSYPAAQRVTRLNDVISCRYDTLTEEQNWDREIRIDEPLLAWLNAQREELDLT